MSSPNSIKSKLSAEFDERAGTGAYLPGSFIKGRDYGVT